MTYFLRNIREFTEPFVDDIAVFSDTWENHLQHLNTFLRVIQDSGLTLNLRKCSFALSKVNFVGHSIGSGLIRPDPKKIETLEKLRPPKVMKDVRRLIGFFSYFRNFIPNYRKH